MLHERLKQAIAEGKTTVPALVKRTGLSASGIYRFIKKGGRLDPRTEQLLSSALDNNAFSPATLILPEGAEKPPPLNVNVELRAMRKSLERLERIAAVLLDRFPEPQKKGILKKIGA